MTPTDLRTYYIGQALSGAATAKSASHLAVRRAISIADKAIQQQTEQEIKDKTSPSPLALANVFRDLMVERLANALDYLDEECGASVVEDFAKKMGFPGRVEAIAELDSYKDVANLIIPIIGDIVAD